MPLPHLKQLAPILGNASALAAINACNYLVPLITVPILSRGLGVQGYGHLGWATALAGCATLLTDIAFNLAASAEASRMRGEPTRLNALYWDVVGAKAAVAAIASVLALAWGVISYPGQAAFQALLWSTLLLYPASFNASWLLQGIERIVIASLLNVVVRICSLPLVILAISTTHSIPLVAAVLSSTYAASALLSLLLARDVLRAGKPSLHPMRAFVHARQSLGLSVATLTMGAYNQTQVLALARVSDMTNSGLFLAAERFRRAAEGGVAAFASAVFPRLGHMSVASPHRLARAMTLAFIAQATLAAFIAGTLFIAAPLIVRLVMGPSFTDAVLPLRILCGALFLGALNNAVGTNMMIPMGRRRAFSISVTTGAVVGFASIVPLSAAFGAVGAAASTVMAEAVVTLVKLSWLFSCRTDAWSLRDPTDTSKSP